MMNALKKLASLCTCMAVFFTAGCVGDDTGQNGLQLEWTEVQVFGDDQTAPQHLLALPIDVAVSQNGHVFVLDQQDRKVKVYDGKGDFIRSNRRSRGGARRV